MPISEWACEAQTSTIAEVHCGPYEENSRNCNSSNISTCRILILFGLSVGYCTSSLFVCLGIS